MTTVLGTTTTTTIEKQSFFSFPNPINASVARGVAAGVVIMSVAIIALHWHWLMIPLAYGFIARVAAGPRLSLLSQFMVKVAVPVLKLPHTPVAGPPKRFAAAMGVGFSVSAIVLHYGFGLTGISYIVLAALIFAAGLEAVFNFCLGCKIFGILMRFGIIPESICEDCADIEARYKRLAEQGLLPEGNPCMPGTLNK
jgi:hypothetical protein